MSNRRASMDPPTPAERQLFKTYDKNKTGAIEVDELRDLMADLGLLSGRTAGEASSYVVATFSSADADKDMALNLSEFTAYHRRATAPRLSDRLAEQHPEQLAALRAGFSRWAAFGVARKAAAGAGPPELGTAHWAKLCRDTGVVGPRGLTSTEADLVFMKVKTKGAQRIGFSQFVDALGLVAARKGLDVLDLVRQVNACAGPAINGTQIDPRRSFDPATSPAAAPIAAAKPALAPSTALQRGADGGAGKPSPSPSATPPAGTGNEFFIPAHYRRCPTPETPVAEILLTPSPGGAVERRGGAESEETPGDDEQGLEELLRVFAAFSGFGAGNSPKASTPPAQMEMSSQQFSKLCRDAGLTGAALAPAAVDLCFAKARPRGARRLRFDAFIDALALVAQEKGAEELEVLAAVVSCPGPRSNSTAPEYVRLADKAAFTGVHAREAARG